VRRRHQVLSLTYENAKDCKVYTAEAQNRLQLQHCLQSCSEQCDTSPLRNPCQTRCTPPFSVRQARPGQESPPGRTVPAPFRARCGTRRLPAGQGPGECASRVNQRSLFCGAQRSDWSSGPRLSGVQLPRRRLLQLTGQLVARSTIKTRCSSPVLLLSCSSWQGSLATPC